MNKDIYIVKRDGRKEKFDKVKIKKAILKAMKQVGIVNNKTCDDVANKIYDNVVKKITKPTVKDIETNVYYELIHNNALKVAKSYEEYRAIQEFKRINSEVDNSVLTLVNGTNEDTLKENSNKNGIVLSTQRDLMAGEVSKDIVLRKILPPNIVQAHKEGAIHYHDMDYAISPMTNCFSGDTEFITDLGIRKFNQCQDGQIVQVLDKNSEWQKATVKKYGKQKLQTVTISSGRTVKKIRCTSNHRWLLKNGEITTDLKVGDKLWLLQEQNKFKINPHAFCLGFVLGDGSDHYSGTSEGVRVRLCGNKTKNLEVFLKCGYTLSTQKVKGNDDIFLCKYGRAFKENFISNHSWQFMSKNDLISLFIGYYEADGFKDRNGIATADSNLAQMIREISALAGYHITSEKFEIRDTNYKKNSKLYTFRFMKSQPTNRNWIVKDIYKEDRQLYDVWCVEEPKTKTFMLNGGVVTGNCCLVNLEDMLQNGTVINDKLVEKPKSFETACTVATQIMAQVSSNQYGGQSITIRHLAPFLKITYDKYFNKYIKDFNKEISEKLAKDRMMEQLKNGIQTIRYQLSTICGTNGQSPFSTIYLEIAEGSEYEKEEALICEEMIKQRLEGMKNYKGQVIGETFPKLVYVLDKHNCLEGGKYDYITKLCAKCNVKRLVPDYQSAKIMRENHEGNTFPPMGCRSHLSPYKDENGNYKWYGRFNQGVVTINLPQIGILAKGDMDLFWKIFDERLELCKEALLFRHNSLLGTKSDVAPILWQHGGYARLNKGEKIDKLLMDNYSSISLGYVGCFELCQAMLRKSHTTPEGEKFIREVMNHMKNKCDEWKDQYNIGFSLYGTPAENTVYRFCRLDKQNFGEIPNITDKLYYTNSYHVNVREEIDAFRKLKFESQFHNISNGGCISYIEVPDMSKNLEAVEQIINYIYHNIQYAEINTKPDVCYKCGFEGQMENGDDYKWYCPNCGNNDESEMQVMRRTCGYIGSSYWSKGRTEEIKERVLHL